MPKAGLVAPTLPSIEEMNIDPAVVETLSPPPPAPVVEVKPVVVDLDAIVKASPVSSLGAKINESPELLFGPMASALSSLPGMNAAAIKTRLYEGYRVVLEACDWVKSGKAHRQFAIDAHIKGLLAKAAELDRVSSDKNDEGRKARGSILGLNSDDPIRKSRLKRGDDLMAEAVRLRDESRAIEAQVGAIRMAAAAQA